MLRSSSSDQRKEQGSTGCKVDFNWIGDGNCDLEANNLECEYDAGDCECIFEDDYVKGVTMRGNFKWHFLLGCHRFAYTLHFTYII